ncbi:M15 family metallopeptidase [Leucobacter rhizosphaerae]|uniref:M15 family metallopeptidase n=1 Tax=Leucobacter rhizosphaerae TaxID=2932245 RepID=A0ABY4FX66_9MICO|nr:M15 family metallopeptidase [Leucobacter rhizosphaerae]UOQ60719.1 M15 family metallopeptidase [Leucobacter rhizosphaerae]
MTDLDASPARSTRRLALVGLGCAAICLVALLALRFVPELLAGAASGSGVASWGGILDPAPTPTAADGVIDAEHPLSVFDTEHPAISGLAPDLLAAVQAAATDAAAEGVQFEVNSGWRSPALQEQLLEQAVADYGSREEAARWVATPETSSHVTGDAIDVGPFDASLWLSQYGAAYGLCQTYANESWHFELRAEAVESGCPTAYLDPTEDPRLQR